MAITDYFNNATVSTRPDAGALTAQKLIGAASITVDTTAGWPQSPDAVHFVIYQVDASGNKVAGTQTDWKGIVTSSTAIGSLTLKAGTDQVYPVGSKVIATPTGAWADDIITGLLAEHKQTGLHGAITADSVTVATGKITTTAVGKLEDAGTPLSTYRANTMFDHVASGGVWSGDSYGVSRNASMTALVCYINGRRISISAVTARSFTASKDTYVDVLDNADGTGTLVYTEVANNAASPALASNSIRIAIIVTGATFITNVGSINQGEESKVLPIASSVPYQTVDSLGNLICPRDPNRKILGYRQLTSDASNTATSATAINLSTPIIVPTGRKISITVNGYHFFGSTGSTNNYVGIYEGASLNALTTRKQEVKEFHASAGAGTLLSMGVVYTPSTANVWISVSLHGDAGTKTITGNATIPIALKVELV